MMNKILILLVLINCEMIAIKSESKAAGAGNKMIRATDGPDVITIPDAIPIEVGDFIKSDDTEKDVKPVFRMTTSSPIDIARRSEKIRRNCACVVGNRCATKSASCLKAKENMSKIKG